MAVDHVHSVKLENGNYHHLFNLGYMSEDEIQMLQIALDSKPIPTDKIDVLNGLRITVNKMISIAIAKNEKAQEETEDKPS